MASKRKRYMEWIEEPSTEPGAHSFGRMMPVTQTTDRSTATGKRLKTGTSATRIIEVDSDSDDSNTSITKRSSTSNILWSEVSDTRPLAERISLPESEPDRISIDDDSDYSPVHNANESILPLPKALQNKLLALDLETILLLAVPKDFPVEQHPVSGARMCWFLNTGQSEHVSITITKYKCPASLEGFKDLCLLVVERVKRGGGIEVLNDILLVTPKEEVEMLRWKSGTDLLWGFQAREGCWWFEKPVAYYRYVDNRAYGDEETEADCVDETQDNSRDETGDDSGDENQVLNMQEIPEDLNIASGSDEGDGSDRTLVQFASADEETRPLQSVQSSLIYRHTSHVHLALRTKHPVLS